MSKAEDLAEKTYPKGDIYIFGDGSIACQVAYVKGYHQAEKDLELTYDDICEIMEIRDDVLEMDSYENLYEEILKRFKEERNERSV